MPTSSLVSPGTEGLVMQIRGDTGPAILLYARTKVPYAVSCAGLEIRLLDCLYIQITKGHPSA